MPVDLSSAGQPSAYPRRPRFWPWWFCIWLACAVLGAAIALLLWPKGERAGGAWFWFCVVGIPNGIFGLLFAIDRAGYEAMWYRAYHRNRHRDRWLAQRICFAQKPLRVLGVGCCLPLSGQTLAQAITAGVRLPRQQLPRSGAAVIEHCRFEEKALTVEAPAVMDPFARIAAGTETGDTEAAEQPPAKMVALLALKMADALKPLTTSLHALTRYESAHWPQVRVLAESGEETLREHQVRDALHLAGLPPLSVQAVPASQGLLLADAWLDAREARPLLVVAAAWHDGQPAVGSTEGCLAVLLDAGLYRLPEDVPVMARLHRPVEGKADEIEYCFANAVLWGKADFAAVTRAWITRAVERCNRGLRIANLDAIAKSEAQCEPARIVGDFGSASGWLSVAAAIECGVVDGPQLIIGGVQSAILHVLPGAPGKDPSSPEHSVHDRSETEPATA
ncbi:hypothetical protein [Paraburkholderia heleia]|uniref:hypothetical protein n=1 Tax=Paraburkholderia heleia TaxID=634127 RepID=UPI0005A7E7D1|nr:hypothetical protein [Paraburkholderia heleia]